MMKSLKWISLGVLLSFVSLLSAQTVTITTSAAGSLPQLLSMEQQAQVRSLTIEGPINGTDLALLRHMAGAESEAPIQAQLEELNLENAVIYEGGDPYYVDITMLSDEEKREKPYFTKHNEIGFHLFYGCKYLKKIVLPTTTAQIIGGAFENCPALESISISPINPNFMVNNGGLMNRAQTDLFVYPSQTKGDIHLPEGLLNIHDYAFSGCKNITNITLPNTLQTIGEDAFAECSALTNITLPYGITTIPEGAFYGCTSLQTVVLPPTVKGIGKYAFAACVDLQNIQLPEHLGHIDMFAFSNCKRLTNIRLPQSLGKLGEGAFESCSSLTNIILPSSLQQLSDGIFANCVQLKNVTLPDEVTYIGAGENDADGIFENCIQLTSIHIPASVTHIAPKSFANCIQLQRIIINAVQPPLCDASTFDNIPQQCVLSVPQGYQQAYQEAVVWSRFHTLPH